MENAEELQRALHRFFTAQDATSKGQIEQLLSNTKEQPEAWAQARSLLTHSTDQYVQWFAVSMMDVLLQHRWQTLSNEEQIEVRKFLLEYLHAKYKELPSFVGKKMAKVYLGIGLKDWPQRYPEFLDHIFLLVKSQESRQLGVELLALLAEEFTRGDSHLLASRKLELKTHVLEAAPGILELLGQLLQGLFEHNVRVTSISDSQGFQALASPVKRYLRTDFYEGTFDEESIRLARTSLEALMRYFAWIPLNGSFVVPSLLQAIFQYIHLHNATTSVSAFDCINEILEKNYVPKETQEWLTQVFTHVFSLLRSLTAKEGGLEGLDDLFIEKCTRFTSLFVSNHLQRVEADPSFPVNEFLALLFKYTFLQTSLQLFLQCVDVWLSVLDGLREQALLPSSSSGLSSERYRDAIVSLYGEMMKNTLFVTNASQLQLLDATEKVDDQHTELDLFVEKCMEVVVKCAECYPNPNLQQLCSAFMENSQRICQATEVLSQVERNQEARDYIDNILKDQRSLLIALGGIQTYFLNNFENTFTACNVLLHATLDVGDFLVKHHLYPLGPHVSALQAQLFGTLRSYTHWFVHYLSSLQPSSLPSSPIVSRTSSGAPVGGAEDSPQQVQFRQTITRCVDATCLVIAEANAPPEVRLAAVYCLDSVTSTLRPKGLLGVSRLSWLMENVDRITTTDTKEQTVRVYVAISNALLLPTRGVPVNSSEQHWDERNNKFQEFIASLTRPFVELAQMEPSHYPAESVGQAELKLSALGGIVAAVKTEGTKTSKDIIYKALEPIIPACLSMVRMCLNQPRILKAVLEFFLVVFDVLKTYLGATFIQETLGTFMELLGGERIQLILQSQDESGITVVCKLLDFLTYVVRDPSNLFSSFLPAIYTLAMEQINPILEKQLVTGEANQDVMVSFYRLVKHMVSGHWNYFSSSRHYPHLIAILQSIIYSFRSTDIIVVAKNLKALKQLNESHVQLYSRDVFKESLRLGLLQVLLEVLLSRSHALLQDDIVHNIHAMVVVHPPSFFENLLPTMLANSNQLREEQKQHLMQLWRPLFDQRQVDLPTFSRILSLFVNDWLFCASAEQPS